MKTDRKDWTRREGLRNVGCSAKAPHLRTYTPPKVPYPRISLHVYWRWEGFRLSVSLKRASGTHWESCDIPEVLVNEVIELFKEALEAR